VPSQEPYPIAPDEARHPPPTAAGAGAPQAAAAAPQPEPEVRRLHRRVVAIWRLASLIWTAILSSAALAALLASDLPPWLALGVLALGLVHAAVVPPLRYRHWRYRVGPVDVRVWHGWLWRHASVVLHSRIQHVDTRQGPIERMMGLSTVVMFTAGSVGAMVAIPGLAAAEAESLRDHLADVSGLNDAL
jgi:uncharacterized protein